MNAIQTKLNVTELERFAGFTGSFEQRRLHATAIRYITAAGHVVARINGAHPGFFIRATLPATIWGRLQEFAAKLNIEPETVSTRALTNLYNMMERHLDPAETLCGECYGAWREEELVGYPHPDADLLPLVCPACQDEILSHETDDEALSEPTQTYY